MKHGKSTPPAPFCVAVAEPAASRIQTDDDEGAIDLLEEFLEGATNAAATHPSCKPAPSIRISPLPLGSISMMAAAGSLATDAETAGSGESPTVLCNARPSKWARQGCPGAKVGKKVMHSFDGSLTFELLTTCSSLLANFPLSGTQPDACNVIAKTRTDHMVFSSADVGIARSCRSQLPT